MLLTLSRRAQDVAFKQLNDNRVDAERGAAIALDPRTGAVQALVSMPSFDPNPLVSHDTAAAEAAYDKLDKDREQAAEQPGARRDATRPARRSR